MPVAMTGRCLPIWRRPRWRWPVKSAARARTTRAGTPCLPEASGPASQVQRLNIVLPAPDIGRLANAARQRGGKKLARQQVDPQPFQMRVPYLAVAQNKAP